MKLIDIPDDLVVEALAEHMREQYADPLAVMAKAAGPLLREYAETLPLHQRQALDPYLKPSRTDRLGGALFRQTRRLAH